MRKSSAAKRLLLAFLLLYFILLLAPAAIFAAGQSDPQPQPSPVPPSSAPDFLQGQALPKPAAPAVFTLTDAATGHTLQVEDRLFLAACLACEMDLSSPEEALKAQAVAAYSYYSRLRAEDKEIAFDSEQWLVYVPEAAMRERWGEDYEGYHALLTGIVDQVYGQLLTYQGKPALACYFAISPGSTEAAANVWSGGQEHPYLQAVASPGDAFSDGYLSRAVLTEEEFRDAALDFFSDDPPDFSGPAADWLSDIENTPSRLVKTASLGGKTVTGTQLRSAFGLRSACFTCAYADGAFHFTVRGWGHGVGMSQAGAVFMAKNGATYQEILAHYYPGATLEPAPADASPAPVS